MTDELMMAIRWAFGAGHLVLRAHAVIEMRLDRLDLEDIRLAGQRSELLEDYVNRKQGHMLLLLGYVGVERPIHIVVATENYERDWSRPLIVVTVYRPEPPMWADERTRARKSR